MLFKTTQEPSPRRPAFQRLLPSFILIGTLTVVFGCSVDSDSAGCECSVGGVSEPMLYGPFDHEPQRTEDGDEADEINAATERMYFLWGHPDATNTPLTYRVFVQIPGMPEPGQLLGEPTSEIDSQVGYFYFEKPDTGWPLGHYRVECDLDGTTFSAVEFDNGPGAGRN